MSIPESMRASVPQESSRDTRQDVETIKRFNARHKTRIETLSQLIGDRLHAVENNVETILPDEVVEAKELFMAANEAYSSEYEDVINALKLNVASEIPLAMSKLTLAETHLQNAFERYAEALKRSYQN